MITLEEGLRRTCLLPLFSALLMHLRAEANEFINTMVASKIEKQISYISSLDTYGLNSRVISGQITMISLDFSKIKNYTPLWFGCFKEKEEEKETGMFLFFSVYCCRYPKRNKLVHIHLFWFVC